MSLRDQLADQALTLDPADRAYLADVLEQSLSHGQFATPELSAEWSAEIDRRLADYDRGDSPAVDVDHALRGLADRLAQRRAP